MKLRPRVVCLSGPVTRDLLFGDSMLERPGIYIGLWMVPEGVRAYVGQSRTSVASRVFRSTHFRHPNDVELMFIITEGSGLLGPADCPALERIAHLAVEQTSGTKVSGQEPFGAMVGLDRYTSLRKFWGEAAIRIRACGVLFSGVPDDVLMQGPRTSLRRLPTERDLALVQHSDRHLLCRGDADGEVVKLDEDAWMLTTGSVIRRDVVTSSSATAGVLREEWLHAGILKAHRDPRRLELTEAVLFPSLSAAGGFAIGCKTLGYGSWRSAETLGGFRNDAIPGVPRPRTLDPPAIARGAVPVALNDNKESARLLDPAVETFVAGLGGAASSTLDAVASLVAKRLLTKWIMASHEDPLA